MTSPETFAALVASIHACCDVRGDNDRNRAALIAEGAELTPVQQVDMTEHFDEQTAAWAAFVQPCQSTISQPGEQPRHFIQGT